MRPGARWFPEGGYPGAGIFRSRSMADQAPGGPVWKSGGRAPVHEMAAGHVKTRDTTRFFIESPPLENGAGGRQAAVLILQRPMAPEKKLLPVPCFNQVCHISRELAIACQLIPGYFEREGQGNRRMTSFFPWHKKTWSQSKLCDHGEHHNSIDATAFRLSSKTKSKPSEAGSIWRGAATK